MFKETKLLRASLAGDTKAFEQLVENYQATICAITLSGTGRIDLSEDLAQETFLNAWKNLHQLRDLSGFRAWLYSIARSLVQNYYRRQKKQIKVSADLTNSPHEETPNPTELLISKEEKVLLEAAMTRLAPKYREPLIMYYRQEQSAAETAKILGLSEATVRTRLHRARNMLREDMAKRLETILKQTGPRKDFTGTVMAAIVGAALKQTTTVVSAAQVTGSAGWRVSSLFSGLAGKGVLMTTALVVITTGVLVYRGRTKQSVSTQRPQGPNTINVQENKEENQLLGPLPMNEATIATQTESSKQSNNPYTAKTVSKAIQDANRPTVGKTQRRTFVQRQPFDHKQDRSLEKGELVGEVITPDGNPVPNATVCLGNGYLTKDGGLPRTKSATWEHGVFYPASLKTDGQGRFVFKPLPFGKTDIWAEHPEWGCGWLPQIDTAGDPVQIVLEPKLDTFTLTGQVLSAKNLSPIPASIHLFSAMKKSIAHTTTEEGGRFSLSTELPWEPFSHVLMVCVPQRGAISWRTLPPCSDVDIEVLIKAEAEVRGFVRDTQGHPIDNANIRLQRIMDRQYGYMWFIDDLATISPQARTDKDGDYLLPLIPTGTELGLFANHSVYSGERKDNVQVSTSQTHIPDITLSMGIIIEGTVRYKDTGEPAQNYQIRVKHRGREMDLETTTNELGYYLVDGLTEGDFFDTTTITALDSTDQPHWVGTATVRAHMKKGDHFRDVDILLEHPFEYRHEQWLQQKGISLASRYAVCVLNNSDIAYRNKAIYEDTLSLYDNDGTLQWQQVGFNTCQDVGGSNQLVYSPFDRSLWVSENVSRKLMKVSQTDGSAILEFSAQPVNALACDPLTGNVWALLSDGTIFGSGLVVINKDGELVKQYPHKGNNITYSSHDDCFWLVGKNVQKISRQGELLNQWSEKIGWVAVSVAVDERDGSIWVAERAHSQTEGSQDRIWVLEPSGQVRTQVKLPTQKSPSSLALDTLHDAAWIGTYTGLLKLDMAGNILVEIPLRATYVTIELDTGYVWVSARDKGVHRLDREGRSVTVLPEAGKYNRWICLIPLDN